MTDHIAEKFTPVAVGENAPLLRLRRLDDDRIVAEGNSHEDPAIKQAAADLNAQGIGCIVEPTLFEEDLVRIQEDLAREQDDDFEPHSRPLNEEERQALMSGTPLRFDR